MGLNNDYKVDDIVRLVIARLADNQSTKVHPNNSSSHSLAIGVDESARHQNSSELIIPGNVITLSEVQDRLKGISSVSVSTAALLTPALKDELKHRKIKVHRLPVSVPQAGQSSDVLDDVSRDRIRVFLPSTKAISGGLWKSGCQVIQPVVTESAWGVEDISARIVQGWKEWDRCVWCATKPYAALIAVSNLAAEFGIRALILSEPEDLPRAIQEAHPNVMVLDDRRWGARQIFQLSKDWFFYHKSWARGLEEVRH